MAKLIKLAVLFVLFVAAIAVAVNWRSVFGHAEVVDSRIETIDSLIILKNGGMTGAATGLSSEPAAVHELPDTALGSSEINDSNNTRHEVD